MKFDMCGAASVLGTFRAIAEMKPKLNLVGLVPRARTCRRAARRSRATSSRSMSGQTVEVLNTDAEGRLILADALTYAERYEPRGRRRHRHADRRNGRRARPRRQRRLQQQRYARARAARRRRRRVRPRLADAAWEDYQEGLESNFADFANVAGRAGGSITAACFLSRFTRKYDWAHLDIAGTAWKEGKEKGATGRPVPLLATWLLAQRSHRMTRLHRMTRSTSTRSRTNRCRSRRRLVAKAGRLHGSVRVLTPDANTTGALDRLMWQGPAARVHSALPDVESRGERDADLDRRDARAFGPAAVLVNLHPEPPPFFSRFERLAEVVGADDAQFAGGTRAVPLLSRAWVRIAPPRLVDARLTMARDARAGGMPTARELLEQADALMRRIASAGWGPARRADLDRCAWRRPRCLAGGDRGPSRDESSRPIRSISSGRTRTGRRPHLPRRLTPIRFRSTRSPTFPVLTDAVLAWPPTRARGCRRRNEGHRRVDAG